MSTPLPKLSYVLLSHNREKYIRGAIESAFAQDYEGELEYIFSDDCSTDRTFEIIKECVAAYKGNRRVVVTQTPKNLHLAGNTNHAVQFVESDWIVRADDDDYSAVDRCTLIGKAIAQKPDAAFVVTKVRYFTEAKEDFIIESSRKKAIEPVQIIHLTSENTFFNCREYSYKAWNVRTYREYPQLHPTAYYVDDLTCYYRSRTLGDAIIIEAPLVYARAEHDNMSSGGVARARSYSDIITLERFNSKYHNITLQPIIQLRDEIVKYSCERNRPAPSHILNELNKEIRQRTLLSTYWEKGVFNRLRIRRALGYSGLFSLLRCLPLPLFAACVSIYRRFKSK